MLIAGALVCNVAPYAGAALDRTDVRAAQRSFWAPAVSFLAERWTPNYRVEVVPTFDHWEAYWLPRAGIPLARGWYRQIDIARNELFYEKPLAPAAYRRWLRGMGVRFVVLPATRLGQKGEEREAALLRSGRSGLHMVFTSPELRIYAVPRPEPILTGPGAPVVTRLDHAGIAGRLPAAGSYRLKIRYTRYWRVRAGAICVSRGRGGMTLLTASRPGRVTAPGPAGAAAVGSERASADRHERKGRDADERPHPESPAEERCAGEGGDEEERCEEVREPVEAGVLGRAERRERHPPLVDRHRDEVGADYAGEEQAVYDRAGSDERERRGHRDGENEHVDPDLRRADRAEGEVREQGGAEYGQDRG